MVLVLGELGFCILAGDARIRVGLDLESPTDWL